MRYLLLAGLLAISCNTPKEAPQVAPPAPIVIRDTVYTTVPVACNTDSLQNVIDSVSGANKQLAQKLLHAKLIISNAKYYVAICNRNPSQTKFLRGWMNRVLE